MLHYWQLTTNIWKQHLKWSTKWMELCIVSKQVAQDIIYARKLSGDVPEDEEWDFELRPGNRVVQGLEHKKRFPHEWKLRRADMIDEWTKSGEHSSYWFLTDALEPSPNKGCWGSSQRWLQANNKNDRLILNARKIYIKFFHYTTNHFSDDT